MKYACLIAIVLISCLEANAQTNSYKVIPIVNNTQDPFLVNPWGLSRPVKASLGEGEWWVSDNATGYTTLYRVDQTGTKSIEPLVITIPTAIGTGIGSPTGTAYNGTGGPAPASTISRSPLWMVRSPTGMQD
jgi:hypothetical protein